MTWTNLKRAAPSLLALVLLWGCTLRSEEVRIDLPDPAPGWMAECYLYPDAVPVLVLAPNVPYFRLPDSARAVGWLQTLATRTTATLRTRTATGDLLHEERLAYFLPDSAYPLGRFQGLRPTAADPALAYELLVELPEQQLRATTQFGRPIALRPDDLSYTWNPRDTAGVSLRLAWDDPDPTRETFYRVLFNDFRPDSIGHFEFRDRQFSPGRPFFLTYTQSLGDSLEITVYDIPESYYDFVQTTEQAISAAGNPFIEPVLIRSMFSGGLGAFVALHPGQPLRLRLPEAAP